MELLKKTERRVVSMTGYSGVCDGCGTPIEYADSLIVVIIKEFSDRDIVLPIDTVACPYCNLEFSSMTVYKNLDITQELENIK